MSNVNYEQQLVDSYWDKISTTELNLINKNCKAKKHSDLEYVEKKTNTHWRIEAKSHMSNDAYNAVHKIFGELLKETGRGAILDETLKYGLLLDGRYCIDKKISGKDFFMKYFSCINYEKYKQFGLIIPIEKIIVYTIDDGLIENINWNKFVGD
jgi:hypothetical protein